MVSPARRRRQRNADRRVDRAAAFRVVDVQAVAQGEVAREVGVGDVAARAEHERAGLEGVGTAARIAPEALGRGIELLQLRAGVQRERAGEDGDMEVLALRDHVRAGQGHQVLAADEAADAAVVGVDRPQVGAVAATPDGALDERRHHLAAPAQHLAVVADEEQRVVDRVHRRAAGPSRCSRSRRRRWPRRRVAQPLRIVARRSSACCRRSARARPSSRRRATPSLRPSTDSRRSRLR